MPESAQTRDGVKYPKRCFLYTPSDEPSTWKILVRTPAGTIDRGLLGDAHAALTTGFRGNTSDIPEADKKECLAKLKRLYQQEGMDWPATTKMAADEADLVYRTGLIFKAGTYPDKAVSVSEEELAEMAAAFTEPVEAELEHLKTSGISTFLDGKLGQLVEVWVDGPNLYGRVAVPRWLDALWAEAGRKVSVVLSKTTKHLQRIGLVLDPRVPDAAVMAAYTAFAASRHDTPHGQGVLQAVHDMAARSGAICTEPAATYASSSTFVSGHESTAMQQIHDMATAHGAACPGTGSAYYSASTHNLAFVGEMSEDAFAGSRHSRSDAADIQQIHDITTRQGAGCAPTAVNPPRRSTSMARTRTPLIDSLKFWRSVPQELRDEAREREIPVPDEEMFMAVDEEAKDAREQAYREQLAAFEAKQKEAENKLKIADQTLANVTMQRLQGEAAAFADGLITGHKLLPAEREGLIATLTQAGLDDVALGAITFANGQQGSRVEQTKAMFVARPAHQLTAEQLDGRGELTVVMGGQPKPPEKYTKEQLLAMTPGGRKTLELMKQQNGHARTN